MNIRRKKIRGYFAISILLILCLCFVSIQTFVTFKNHVSAISSSADTTNIGDLLVSDYESKTKIFNREKLNTLYFQLTNIPNATYDDVLLAARSEKNCDDFYNQNDKKIITLNLDDLLWNAVYLSTNRQGEAVLTLWLASSTLKAEWNEHDNTANGRYPANMYGTSKIRAVSLNNGGYYATSLEQLSNEKFEKDENSIFAKYTMENSESLNGSLVEYIDIPANVEWQETQKSTDINGYSYNFNNDRYSVETPGSMYGGIDYTTPPSGVTKEEQIEAYTGWKNDYIWLPAMTETGWNSSYLGKWKTHSFERGNTNGYTWTRSANADYMNYCWTLTNTGDSRSNFNVKDSYYVRPAFHLNLAKVNEASAMPMPQIKGDAKKYYDNDNDVTFELNAVNTDVIDILSLTATDMDGNSISSLSYTINGSVLSFNASQVGKYVVTVKPKDGECWADGTDSEKSYTYYLKYHVTPLRFATDTSNLVYKGTKQYIEVENYIEDFMTVTPSTGATFEKIPSGDNAGNWSISATNAGDYRVTVALKNTEFMEWTDNNLSSPKSDLTFNISKKTLNVTASSLWSTEVYTSKEYELTLDCADEDIGKLRFEGYYTGGGITEEIAVDSQPVMSTTEKKVTIKLPRLSDKGTYKYILKLAEGIAANGNYTLVFENNFEVGNKKIDLSANEIVWRYANANIDGGAYKTVGELDTGGVFNVDYNGYAYNFEVNVLELSEDIRDSIEYEYIGTQSATDVKIGSGNVVEYYEAVFKISPRNGNTSIDIVTSEFTLKWRVNKALFDLSNVKWDYTSPLPYNELSKTITLSGLPRGVTAEIDGNRGTNVNEYTAEIISLTLDGAMGNNYVRPIIRDRSTYIYNGSEGDVPWTLQWEIVAGVLNLEWEKVYTYTDKNGRKFVYPQVKSEYGDKVEYEYYTASGDPIDLGDIEVVPEQQDRYIAVAVLKDEWVGKYEINENTKSSPFTVGSTKSEILIGMEEREYEYDGEKHGDKWKIESGTISLNRIIAKYYAVGEDGQETLLEEAPRNAGKYVVRFEIEEAYQDTYELGVEEIAFEITKAKITAIWNTEGEIPVIEGANAQVIEYEFCDGEGNVVEESQLEAGKTYKVKAKIKAEYASNYEFVDENGIVLAEPTETEAKEFEIKKEEPTEPEDPTNPEDPTTPTDPTNPNDPEDPDNNGGDNKDPDEGSSPIDLGKFGEFMSEYWQPIVTAISIILILIFTGKGLGYASKRRKIKKTIERKYSAYYAIAGTGLFGLPNMTWTIVAGIMAGVTVLSFIFMLLEKKSYGKAEEELDEAKEEYARKKEEDMKMMFMHMMGGNANGGGAQGGYAYAPQPAIGMEDMRGMINEVVTALLPGVQQMLPQQASTNDELVQKLVEQNAQNEEVIKNLAQGQEKLMKQLTKQQPVEKIVEREVAATSVSEEVLDRLANKLQSVSSSNVTDETILKVVSHSEQNDETIKQLLKNQEKLMEKILELSANQPIEPQVVEKIVEVPVEKIVEKEVKVEVPVEVEKVVEKVVEVPVEKIVEKEVPVEVEKIVEKEVVKEVKVEVPVEVEKVVEKIVEIPAEKPAPKAKVTAPRLTLDEAYEKLSAKQKKIFDTLKAYAMSKDKCKEKKSTYYILLGQSSVNPLVKLTIKKDTTVALFKMEDEFMKDIRRNATNDGTKVKVKETELIVGDMQALATAKEMVDLREDQIERYNEYLREQRSMKKSK